MTFLAAGMKMDRLSVQKNIYFFDELLILKIRTYIKKIIRD
jgi:hypothetical protein